MSEERDAGDAATLIKEARGILDRLALLAGLPRHYGTIADMDNVIASLHDPTSLRQAISALWKSVDAVGVVSDVKAALQALPPSPTTTEIAQLKSLVRRTSDPGFAGALLGRLDEIEVQSKMLALLGA